MNGLSLAASALVPAFLILWYLYSRDKNPEPVGMIVKTFLLGALVCLPVVPCATWLEGLGRSYSGMWSKALVGAFLGAAIPEEGFKFLVLRGWAWRKPAFDEPMDGMVYGATASLGFAALENLLYVGSGGFGLAALRAFTAVPGHALTGVIMGAYTGRAKFTRGAGGGGLLLTGLLVAILLHGAYDCFLMTESGWALLALGVLAVEVFWARRLVRTLRTGQLAPFAAPIVEGAVPPPLPRVPLAPQPHRTAWSVVKLLAGGLGASGLSLLMLLISAALLADGPTAPSISEVVIIEVVLAIPTLIALLIFRSGLQGPFAQASHP